MNTSLTPAAVTILVTGFVVFIVLVAFQVRAVMRHPFPTLRAIEALAASIPLLLLLFAATYVVMATRSAGTSAGTCRTPTGCTSPSPCSPLSGSAT